MTLVPISGNTFPVKDQIKNLGGRWDSVRKVWMVPEAHAAKARELAAGAHRTQPSERPTFSRCVSCGALPSKFNFILKSGECRDCFRDRKEEERIGY